LGNSYIFYKIIRIISVATDYRISFSLYLWD
jgi:hypothetical protein